MPQQIKYHSAIFSLLEVEPEVSAQRLELLAARESHCGIKFPASIREWFSIADAESLFHERTNEDHLQELKELGDPHENSQGYMRVATENQAVVAWFAKLDDSDDPPVFHNNDEWDEDLSTIDWELYAKTFTNFIYDMLSQHHFGGWDTGACLEGTAPIPDESTIQALRAEYSEGPLSHYPDFRVWRFFDSRGQIRIAANTPELLSSNRADWWIEARSLDLLPELLSSVWNVPGIASLEPGGYSPEIRSAGAKVLEAFKRKET